MPKKVIFDDTARRKLCEGIDLLVHLLSITLGPKGGNIGVDIPKSIPKISRASAVFLPDIETPDPFANIGIAFGKEMIQAIHRTAGDGSVTGIILLGALVREGMKQIAAGISPLDLYHGLDKGLENALQAIDALSQPLPLERIKTIWSLKEAPLIAKALQRVGPQGVITVEEGKKEDDELVFVKGMRFNQGFLSSYFCTNADTLSCVLSHPIILVTSDKISSIHEVLPFLQAGAQENRPLFILAEDIEKDALATLLLNKLRGILPVAAAKIPAPDILQQIILFTGATLVSQDKGLVLKKGELSWLGTCERVELTQDQCLLLMGQRRARTMQDVAVLRVGGEGESTIKERSVALNKQLTAIRAAFDHGVVPGGGIAFLRATAALENLPIDKEEGIGRKLLVTALKAPTRQLLLNSGIDPAPVLHALIRHPASFGWNIETGKIEDLGSAGIVDPTLVVKTVLEQAVAMYRRILMTNVLICEDDEES